MGNKLTKEDNSDAESKQSSSSAKAMTEQILSELKTKTTVVKDTTIESGREFHTVETSTYWLPKDDEEQQRLTGQHFAVKELYDGNLLPSIQKSLDFQSGVSVLDVGCGSGIWVMDMISDYPNCQYYGCDMVDTTNKNIKLDQFEFSIGNILKGLPYEDNTFDCSHMRLFVFALREDEWPHVIKELLRVTRPGGVIQITEVDLKMPEEHLEAYHRLLTAVHAVCDQRSQNPRIALELERMVLETGDAEVLQTEYRTCKMNSQSSTAKKFIWDWIELTKGILSSIGPMLKLKNSQEQKKFIHDLRNCLTFSDCLVHFNSVAAKKL